MEQLGKLLVILGVVLVLAGAVTWHDAHAGVGS